MSRCSSPAVLGLFCDCILWLSVTGPGTQIIASKMTLSWSPGVIIQLLGLLKVVVKKCVKKFYCHTIKRNFNFENSQLGLSQYTGIVNNRDIITIDIV